jgi:glycosyltransferase involved in cell wall biosynthesis
MTDKPDAYPTARPGGKRVQLAALVESVDHVCCRYRLRAFQPLLRDAGHELSMHSLPRGFWNRFGIGRDVKNADAVILQRKLLSRVELGLLCSRARRLLFDFDDAVWLRDSYSSKGSDSPRRLRRFRSIVSRCDDIVAGNTFLAENAERLNGGRPVTVIPTCVNVQRYPLAEHASEPGQAHLVWIGSSSTLQGLQAIAPLLEEIGVVLPGVSLKIICDRFLSLKNLRTIDCNWTEASETTELAAADIGISWIPDDPWSRGKCGLKILQYMAAGLPIVANPVGVQIEMVRDGETGFLVHTDAQWIEAIRMLAQDPDLRRRMGQASRKRVEEKYSVEAGAARWTGLLTGWGRQRIPA